MRRKEPEHEGHTVSGLPMSVYAGPQDYTETLFPARDNWRLSWDAGEQLGGGKINSCMSFSSTSHISLLVCWLVLMCGCTFVPCWAKKKKRCICFCYNKEWWHAEILRFCRLGSRSAAENLLGLLHTWNKEPEKGKGKSRIKKVSTLILLIH